MATSGRTSGLSLDPIEKKPLYHFLPGQSVLSFGTAGCNLGCRWCQNWQMSTARNFDRLSFPSTPITITEAALRKQAAGVAFTYNDPVIYAEYAIEIAEAVHQAGLVNVAVTAGSINPQPRTDFFAVMDAANVDLKSLNPDFYRRYVGGHLEVVQETLRYLAHETSVWLEVTTLVIPGLNDSDSEITALSRWVATELGADVPLHLSAFHPAHRLTDRPPTPAVTLRRARRIALAQGLNFVYTGNIIDEQGSTTGCPSCQTALIKRHGFEVNIADLGSEGLCGNCQARIPGVWSHCQGS